MMAIRRWGGGRATEPSCPCTLGTSCVPIGEAAPEPDRDLLVRQAFSCSVSRSIMVVGPPYILGTLGGYWSFGPGGGPVAGGASVLEPVAGAGVSPFENNPLNRFFNDEGEGGREVLAGGGMAPPVDSLASFG